MHSDQQNTKLSSCQVSLSPFCLNSLFTFLLKSYVLSTLRNNKSYLFWQQCENIYCIKIPKRSKKNNGPFLNFISSGSKHFIRTSEAIQKRKEKKNQVSKYIVNLVQDENLHYKILSVMNSALKSACRLSILSKYSACCQKSDFKWNLLQE